MPEQMWRVLSVWRAWAVQEEMHEDKHLRTSVRTQLLTELCTMLKTLPDFLQSLHMLKTVQRGVRVVRGRMLKLVRPFKVL